VVVHVFITVSGHVKISEYFAQTNIPRWGVCAVRKIAHIARATFMKLRYSEALPASVKISFKELVKRAGQIPWKRAEFRWETVPSRGPTIKKALCYALCLFSDKLTFVSPRYKFIDYLYKFIDNSTITLTTGNYQ